MKNSEDVDYLYFQKKCRMEEFLTKRKITVGIHGIVGSFTDEALYWFAQKKLRLKFHQYKVEELVYAENVIRSVVDRKVDRGIFAVANSGSGGYLSSIEAMARYNFKVLALFTMPINMCMLCHKSVSDISKIKEFRGHPVAIAQCRKTLKTRWPYIPVHPDTDELDTALSAKMLKEGQIPSTTCVFASKRAAKTYNLRILVEGVHDHPFNATSFIVIKK